VHMLGYFDFWNMQETMTADAAVDRTHRNFAIILRVQKLEWKKVRTFEDVFSCFATIHERGR